MTSQELAKQCISTIQIDLLGAVSANDLAPEGLVKQVDDIFSGKLFVPIFLSSHVQAYAVRKKNDW